MRFQYLPFIANNVLNLFCEALYIIYIFVPILHTMSVCNLGRNCTVQLNISINVGKHALILLLNPVFFT